MIRSVGLFINEDKKEALKFGEYVKETLQSKGIKCHQNGNGDVALVLGGDGTLLSVSKLMALKGIPLLGINFGRLGFLNEIEVKDFDKVLENLLEGKFRIEERLMLKIVVERKGKTIYTDRALNDVVLAGAFSRLIHLNVAIDDAKLGLYSADGLIVSTPTGSTAYSLSAGGPIVPPNLKNLLITPVCPHSLTSRPMVVGEDNKITVNLMERCGKVMLTTDGQDGIKLKEGDKVIITKADVTTKLIKISNKTFYSTLAEKMKSGNRFGSNL